MERYIYLLLLFGWELLLLYYAWHKFNKVFFSPSFYTLSVFAVSTSLCIYCVNFWQIHFYPITFFIIGLGLLIMVIAESCFYRKKRLVGKSEKYLSENLRGENSYKDLSYIFEVPLLKASTKKYKSQVQVAKHLGLNRITLRKKLEIYKDLL